MQQSVASKVDSATASSLFDRVVAYQNAEFIERLKDKLELNHKEAEVLFVDIKQFLYLSANRHGQWSPPPKIDAGWHEFTLYTKDYACFCNEMFGRFMHHIPRLYLAPNPKGGTWATVHVAREMFGELNENWDIHESMRPKSADGVLSQATDIDPCSSTCGCSAACASDPS